jgi:hypothetical protein
VQEPAAEAAGLSGPAYWAAGAQLAIPEVTSVPENVTESARLYQPLASGRRTAAALTDGSVLSILIVLMTVVVPPSLSAEHVNCVPAVSAVSVFESQPVVDVMIDSGSE